VPVERPWDVAVIGAGPAGLAAAHTAAAAGARTLVLERARHPRYKTCGGGLIGTSLAAMPRGVSVPARDRTHTVTFTLDGRRRITRHDDGRPVLTMVSRTEFDAALCAAAAEAGAEIAEHSVVREIADDGERLRLRTAGRDDVSARIVVGADGSAGISARYVGVRSDQVDLGLELELPVAPAVERDWAGRLLIDWGPIAGSYGWVFPKGDSLTVGVIAERGLAEPTRRYLRAFVDRLGLSGIEPSHDSGHLTRCRAADSPMRRGRVLVAGDAAGLLEPWTREGISFALRSGALAGAAAAEAASAARSGAPAEVGVALDRYVSDVTDSLCVEMAAGRRLLTAYRRHPGTFHGALSTPPGWRVFTDFGRGERNLVEATKGRPARAVLAALHRL
jgi:geranylgeranyl reductase family protein